MSMTSAASTRVSATAGGIEATPHEPNAAPAASGFELLLAGAQQPETDTSNANNSTSSEHKATTKDSATGADKDPSSPPTKPAAEADSTGLLGTLAPTPPPVAPPDSAAPPADSTGAAPATDVTTAPAPTTLDLAAAALSPDSTTGSGAPSDPPAAPTVETNLSALLAPVSRDAGAAAPPLAHAPTAPNAPNAPTPTTPMPAALTASNNSPVPANASARPPVVDSVGSPPPDRARPQAQPSAAPSGAATFTAPTQTPAPTAAAPGAGEWNAATATVAPPPPAEQLVSVLSPLRTTPTGSYTLRLELKPPEMGRVEMRVEMRDGVLHASIHADREGAAQLVRDSLSELRDRLNAEGVRTGDLTVSDGGVGPGSRDGEDSPASGSPSSGPTNASADDPATATAMLTPNSPDSTSLLDVRV
jgi:flagellar hook-length control protein FliK